MERRLVIVGAGGFGREVADLVHIADGANAEVGFLDDQPTDLALNLMAAKGVANLGLTSSWLPQATDRHVVAIGDPALRRAVVDGLKAKDAQFETLVHPHATVAPSAQLGIGVVVSAGARINADVRIAEHVHIDQNVTIGHDTVVEDFVRINPLASISGSVRLQSGVYVGTGAVILQGLDVGRETVVGASALVTRDIPAFVRVKGIPAR